MIKKTARVVKIWLGFLHHIFFTVHLSPPTERRGFFFLPTKNSLAALDWYLLTPPLRHAAVISKAG